MVTFYIVCRIEVRDDLQFDPRSVAERLRDEVAGAVEDNRDSERDFAYVSTVVEQGK